MVKQAKRLSVKVLGIVCALALLVTALYVPMALSASAADIGAAENEVTFFGFEPEDDPVMTMGSSDTSPNMTRGGDGVGVTSWGLSVSEMRRTSGSTAPDWRFVSGADLEDGNLNAMWGGKPDMSTWSTGGGFRLHNAEGVYDLEPATTYVVSFRINVLGGPRSWEGNTAIKTAYLELGYGFKWSKTSSGQEGNTINGMSNLITRVMECDTDEDVYTLYTENGPVKQKLGSGWKNVVYSFTTPAKLTDGVANSLGFYSGNYYGTSYFVDDVQVVKLGAGKSVAALKDGYNKEVTMLVGNVGDTIPTTTPTVENPDHSFVEWCYDEAGKESAAGATFENEKTVLYAHWDAPVTIHYVVGEGNEDIEMVGQAGETIAYPEDPVDKSGEVDKWFMGWYTTDKYTTEYNNDAYGYQDITLYAKWQEAYDMLTQDFDTGYEAAVKKTPAGKGDDGGKSYKSANYFGTRMSVENDDTGADRSKIVKLDWDSTLTRVSNDETTVEAAEKYNTTENKMTMDGLALTKGQVYTCYFDYYAKNLGTALKVYPVGGTAKAVCGYNFYTEDGVAATIPADAETGVWKTGSFTFTYTEDKADNNNLFIVAALEENKDVEIYFDNIVFSPLQPYQSSCTFVMGAGLPNEVIIGKRGDSIEYPVPVSDSRTFLGWYTSEKYVEKFTTKTLGRKSITAYGQWTAPANGFTDYATAGLFAGNWELKTVSDTMPEVWGIKDDKGTYPHYAWYTGRSWYIVHDDAVSQDGDGYEARLIAYKSGFDDGFADGVAKWPNEAIVSYTENKDGTKTPNYHYDNLGDQPLPLMQVENKTLYKVSYWYKSNGCSNVGSLQLCTSPRDASSWYAFTLCQAPQETVSIAATGWKYVENYVYVNTEHKTNKIFLRYVIKGSKNANTKVDISVDNVRVEKCVPPYAFFDGQNGTYSAFTFGEVGETVKLPAETPVKFGYSFAGWYADKDCTVPFEAVYSETEVPTAYAAYTRDNYVKYDLETWNVDNPIGWFTYNRDNSYYEGTGGINNSACFRINREGGTGSAAMKTAGYFIISSGTNNDAFRMEMGKKYIVQFKYKVLKAPTRDAKLSLSASWRTGYWPPTTASTANFSVATTCDLNVWKTGTLVGAMPETMDPEYDCMYLVLANGDDCEILFDDIEITTLPDGYQAYLVDSAETAGVPQYVSGKLGTSFRSKLPVEPKKDNFVFTGYSMYDSKNNKSELTDEKMVFTEENIRIITGMVRLITEQDFEKDYMGTLVYYGDYAAYDFDYELYDSTAEGNSADNVTSPIYSYHRKGDTMYFENAQILQQNLMLNDSQRYTVTMKVKLGKHFHTDGAVKFASCRTPYYGWSTTGDYYAIAPIKDLVDGEWHEVSYTFNSVEAFITIQTPGYCEVFIDDVVFTRVDPDTPLSTAPKFTEYVQAERDANGNLVKKNAGDIDVTSIIDISLYGGNGFNWLYVIIGGAALIIAAGIAVAIVFIVKKSKAKKTVQ